MAPHYVAVVVVVLAVCGGGGPWWRLVAAALPEEKNATRGTIIIPPSLVGTRCFEHGLVFVRVPKTGSSTVRATVAKTCAALGIRTNASGFLADGPELFEARLPSYRAAEPRDTGYRCSNQHVHLGAWLFDAFPSLTKSLLVSVVREPVAWIASIFHSTEGFCGQPADVVARWGGDVVGFADECRLARRGQFGYLSGGGVIAEDVTGLVDTYDALLVLDRLEDSVLALLAARAPKAFPICALAVGHLNRNPSPAYRRPPQAPEALLVQQQLGNNNDTEDYSVVSGEPTPNATVALEYLRRHPLEAELYTLARLRLDSAIDKLGPTAFQALTASYQPCLLGTSSSDHHRRGLAHRKKRQRLPLFR